LSEFERIYVAGGVTIRSAEQTTVISLPALRRLRFPLASNVKPSTEANLAAQSVLAALALCGSVLAAEKGLDLRSRCLLALTKKPSWEVVAGDGSDPKKFELDASTSITLLNEAIQAAKAVGLPWRDEPLILRPAKKLVDLIRKSQDLAVKSGADEEADS
jgi:CRISPR-associated protein Csb1